MWWTGSVVYGGQAAYCGGLAVCEWWTGSVVWWTGSVVYGGQALCCGGQAIWCTGSLRVYGGQKVWAVCECGGQAVCCGGACKNSRNGYACFSDNL